MWSVLEPILCSFHNMNLCSAHVTFSRDTWKHKCVPSMDFSGDSILLLEGLLLSVPKEYRHDLCAINVPDFGIVWKAIFCVHFLSCLCVYAYVYAHVSMYMCALQMCDLLFSACTFMNVTVNH